MVTTSVTRLSDLCSILTKNYLIKCLGHFQTYLFSYKNLLWQLLETIWLLFIPTSGHTGYYLRCQTSSVDFDVISICRSSSRSRIGTSASCEEARRRIYPNLPYSPYASPTSSPRVPRKPLRETNRVDSVMHSVS